MPHADLCVHYSLKWNYSQNADASYHKFSSFCTALSQHKRASLLLVSGGGKKRKLETVQACTMPTCSSSYSAAKMAWVRLLYMLLARPAGIGARSSWQHAPATLCSVQPLSAR